MFVQHGADWKIPPSYRPPSLEDLPVHPEWQENLPPRFDVVEKGRLYRSGIVFPHHVDALRERYGIVNIISLIPGNRLQQSYDDPAIAIHQFPAYRRKELTPERIRSVLELIEGLEEPALVHCEKGEARTGMVVGAYQIRHGQPMSQVLMENILLYHFINISGNRAMLAAVKDEDPLSIPEALVNSEAFCCPNLDPEQLLELENLL